MRAFPFDLMRILRSPCCLLKTGAASRRLKIKLSGISELQAHAYSLAGVAVARLILPLLNGAESGAIEQSSAAGFFDARCDHIARCVHLQTHIHPTFDTA